jgi:hypothetical protein
MSNRDAVFCVRCGGLAREMLGVAGTASFDFIVTRKSISFTPIFLFSLSYQPPCNQAAGNLFSGSLPDLAASLCPRLPQFMIKRSIAFNPRTQPITPIFLGN